MGGIGGAGREGGSGPDFGGFWGPNPKNRGFPRSKKNPPKTGVFGNPGDPIWGVPGGFSPSILCLEPQKLGVRGWGGGFFGGVLSFIEANTLDFSKIDQKIGSVFLIGSAIPLAFDQTPQKKGRFFENRRLRIERLFLGGWGGA